VFYDARVRLQDIVDCPPLVTLQGDPPVVAFLLAWLRMETTGEWRAIVVYAHQPGTRPPQRKLVDVSGTRVRPIQARSEYTHVRRLCLGGDGKVTDLTPTAD
jgi:hypothetical protein